MKRQAAYHGEIGANGKAYQKGQFIAEQVDYQNRGSKRKKSTGKQEIEPYVWEVAEDPEMRSVFRFLAGIYAMYDHKLNRFSTFDRTAVICESMGTDIKQVESLIARYNNGERWFYPDHEVYL